jgi:hypothetical protein
MGLNAEYVPAGTAFDRPEHAGLSGKYILHTLA